MQSSLRYFYSCASRHISTGSYNKNTDKTETAAQASPQETQSSAVSPAAASASDAGLYYNPNSISVNREYFDTARLNRQQARDAAAATLASVSKTAGASKEAVDTALKEISKIATSSVKEAQLEDLIKAKGFADCVVYISNDGVNVTVPSPQGGLPASSVAKIRTLSHPKRITRRLI